MASPFPSTGDRKSATSSVDDVKVSPTSVDGKDPASSPDSADLEIQRNQQAGVAKIEALHRVFGNGVSVWWLYISIGLLAYAYSLDEVCSHFSHYTHSFSYQSSEHHKQLPSFRN